MSKELCLAAVLAGSFAAAAQADGVTFHFYGAEDCPPCMAFKRNHLDDVRAQGEALGFLVEANVIARTRDVPKPGAFGDKDAMLRSAAPHLDVVYPPIFFVSERGEVVSAHQHDWGEALAAVQLLLESD